MEQFIGCDAHKKFSVFVAVNEKGQAGEAQRVAHDRELYRKFWLDCLRTRQSRWKPAAATAGLWMRWNGQATARNYVIRSRPSDAWH